MKRGEKKGTYLNDLTHIVRMDVRQRKGIVELLLLLNQI